MTIVLALKIGDGVVLGADSASTLVDHHGTYHNSYFNAEKLIHLVKGLPIGAVMYGLNGLAGRSVGSLAKDLRARMADPSNAAWYLDPGRYTMAQVAERMQRFFFDELYSRHVPAGPETAGMGFLIAGFSAGAEHAEVWRIEVKAGGVIEPPTCLAPASTPWYAHWEGQGEAIRRLLLGHSWQIQDRLVAAGISEEAALRLLDAVEPVVHPTMPIQDAIDLVHFLIDTTCGFIRFAPGPATVAQPIDSAVITRHEGFRWVRRKHYFPMALNR